MGSRNLVTVFTKSWAGLSLEALADLVATLGLDGVELPVRPGFQVEPAAAPSGLARASRILESRGVRIRSVAASADRDMIAACGDAGVPLIRIMAPIDLTKGYRASVEAQQRLFDSLLPELERDKVAIGVQNHCDHFVGSAVGLAQLLGKYDPRLVAAVLDPAHCALDGESEEMAVDIAWPLLGLVNLKNAFWQLVGGSEGEPQWKKYWCAGPLGLCSWKAVLAELRRRGYAGDYCLRGGAPAPSRGHPFPAGALRGEAGVGEPRAQSSTMRTPSSRSCFSSTGAGQLSMGETPAVFLGKAMTSRMVVSPARIMTRRSMPGAIPPCGGGP